LQLLKKDPSQRLGSHGDVNVIRQHPYFQGIDWNALKEKRIKPPDTTQALAVSNAQPIFISCDWQLLLTLQLNEGNNSNITCTPFIKW
jgi:hypothetical protein